MAVTGDYLKTQDKLYKSVIEDVVSSCRSVFADDGLDEQILKDIQNMWELRLKNSGATDHRRPTEATVATPSSSSGSMNTSSGGASRRRIRKSNLGSSILQVDGLTDGIMSSDEDDDDPKKDEDEESPPDDDSKAGDDEDEDSPAGDEEEPLNSDDDIPGEESVESLFNCDDVVICQYEKVGQSRGRWTIHLKDGVMNIRGKDFVFKECKGNPELL